MPSIVQAPRLELEKLPKHLKYAYLRDMETLLVIISKDLTIEQKEQLAEVFKRHKLALGWTLAQT